MHETARATREVTEAIEAYRFNDAAGAIYRFVWNVYCDWYLELAKPVLMGEESAGQTETRAMVAWARDEILKLLHPFMPFITEELWAVTATARGLLALAPWPRKAGELSPRAGRADLDHEPQRSVHSAGADCFRGGRIHRYGRRGRNRLGRRSRHRDPLGPRGDEYSAGDIDAAGTGGRFGRDARHARHAGTT